MHDSTRPWAVPTFKAALWRRSGQKPHRHRVRTACSPTARRSTWAGTNGWIATRESTAAASAKLIEFLMSPDVLLSHHIMAYGSAPLYESEFDNAAFQYDYWKVFYDEAQNWKLYGMIGRNSPTPVRLLHRDGRSLAAARARSDQRGRRACRRDGRRGRRHRPQQVTPACTCGFSRRTPASALNRAGGAAGNPLHSDELVYSGLVFVEKTSPDSMKSHNRQPRAAPFCRGCGCFGFIQLLRRCFA